MHFLRRVPAQFESNPEAEPAVARPAPAPAVQVLTFDFR